MTSLKDKVIFIKEYSMAPNKCMTKIYEALSLFHNTVYLFGDCNQTNPVESGSQIHYNYDYSKTVQQMTGKKQTLIH